MTKSTITRERLQELAAGQSGFNLRTATYEESQELARMALTAMDSEPVATSHDALRIQGIDFALEFLTAKPAEPDYAQGIQLSIGCMNAAKSLIANKNVVAFNDDAQKPAPVAPDELLKEYLRLVACMLSDYRNGNYGDAQSWIRHIAKASDVFAEKHGLSPWEMSKKTFANHPAHCVCVNCVKARRKWDYV
ncbi:hypothetical protein [Klebsiella variicola]|uniref:hypothetical protein n=1 Tax=Klebsiella variicola TaxID=244366 RepID=UPI00396C898D